MLCREPECKGVAVERIQDQIVLIPITSFGYAFNHIINAPQHFYNQLQRLVLGNKPHKNTTAVGTLI